MWLKFPKDITIYEDSLQCGNQKVSYDEIKSIRVYIKQTTTNLTAWTGIPTVSDLKSEISLLLIDGNRIDIHVVAYEEWGPFKNKEGMETFKDGFAFSTFLEEKTFSFDVISSFISSLLKLFPKIDINRFLYNFFVTFLRDSIKSEVSESDSGKLKKIIHR